LGKIIANLNQIPVIESEKHWLLRKKRQIFAQIGENI
jgi:hypothetical protein